MNERGGKINRSPPVWKMVEYATNQFSINWVTPDLEGLK